MSILSIFMTAIGLSMDAFAVSVSIGMSCENCRKFDNALKAGGYFGGFQGLMPLLGYFISIKFTKIAGNWDGIIAFVILAFIGGKMIYEAVKSKDEVSVKCYTGKAFLMLAIATSIDALAVGISFALIQVNILVACVIIAAVTGVLSVLGIILGKSIGNIVGNKAEILGGIILIIIGLKIMLF